MITPQICQVYFASLFGLEGVAENAHLLGQGQPAQRLSLQGGWSEGKAFPIKLHLFSILKPQLQSAFQIETLPSILIWHLRTEAEVCSLKNIIAKTEHRYKSPIVYIRN